MRGFRTLPPSVTSAAATLTVQIGVVLLSEGFEAPFVSGAPPGWTKEYVTRTVNWARSAGDFTGGSAAEGAWDAMLYSNSSTNHKTYLVTPAISFVGCGAMATVDFWHKQAGASGQDTLEVYYKTTSGGTWILLTSYTSNVSSWTRRTVVLPI